MALVKPIMATVPAFDATKEHTFTFTSNGGDQVVANKLVIKRQDFNITVYENKVTSYAFEQTVPANTLENGYYYYAYFTTFDVNDNKSVESNQSQFHCYTTPSLELINLPDDNYIQNSNQQFQVAYNQAEQRYLNTLRFDLFDENDNLVSSSPLLYGSNILPTILSYTFSGFENNGFYKVSATGESIDGMVVETDKYEFTARYTPPSIFSLLDLINDCERGCVKIESNVESIEGQVPDEYYPPKFLNSFELDDPELYIQWEIPFEYDMDNFQPISQWTELSLFDSHQYGNYVRWDKGFSVNSDFTFSAFMKVGRLGRFVIIGTEQNGFTIDLIREIPVGETEPKDRFEVNGYVNGELRVHQTSNYIDILSQQSYYLVWFRKVSNLYDLRFVTLRQGINDVAGWDSSNVWFDRITDIPWTDDPYPQAEDFVALAEDMSDVFPLKNVKLFNGIYDNMDITSDVSSAFSTNIPEWTYNTRIACNFNDNLDGGNLDLMLSQIKYFRLKRRKKGTFDWVTLREYEIRTTKDLNIVDEDYFVPSGQDFEYALVPVLDGNIEGTYIIADVATKFAATVIADKYKAFSLQANVTYGGDIKNATFSSYEPLKGKYYVIQRNGQLNCYTGSITVMATGYDFIKTRRIDRQDVVTMVNDLCEFFNNNEVKVLKDWNGMIRLVRFTGSPQVSYNNSYGNGVAYVTANWVEQGDYNNQEDLYNNGLVDIP